MARATTSVLAPSDRPCLLANRTGGLPEDLIGLGETVGGPLWSVLFRCLIGSLREQTSKSDTVGPVLLLQRFLDWIVALKAYTKLPPSIKRGFLVGGGALTLDAPNLGTTSAAMVLDMKRQWVRGFWCLFLR